ncbi:hypothetical protein Dsin_019604 [Dipteronia sinensis]|uniref:RNase H type-1 domain-containing protein n=1 Tax=Dipteronia sinensis TaxID=43782 RepID=A0AAE0E2Z5_9ROSI|nr:hypothetical protein Dsin_019604 [Dipteronia sinensis]
MGFGMRWCNWIKWCISSPSLSVLVNGGPTKQFSMDIGLRQGDPLSPFLFNIAVEVLSSMLDKAKHMDLLKGAVFGNGEVHISHLQFADDTRVVVPHPPFLDLSFYVDGSARGNPGEAGIGGILRDLRGRILYLFSFYVGVLDAFSVEVMAIHRACQLISGKSSVAWRAITIFSDSKSAVDCILGSDFGNLQLVNFVYDIRQFLNSSDGFDIKFMSRSANSSADCLAKAGSLGRRDRLEWGNV